MKKQVAVFILSIGSIVASSKESLVQQGEKIATKVCAACHGAGGHSAVSMYPSLAGQHSAYLESAMKSYKLGDKGPRNNPIMLQQMQNLSNKDIQALAIYFSQQQLSQGEVSPDQVALGQKIYRGGIASKGIPACSACHGPRGRGLKLAGFPALSGQHSEYTSTALKEYRLGKRKSVVNAIMNGVSKKMSDKEITAVSSYVSGLY